jgi:hypothetical protein
MVPDAKKTLNHAPVSQSNEVLLKWCIPFDDQAYSWLEYRAPFEAENIMIASDEHAASHRVNATIKLPWWENCTLTKEKSKFCNT